MQLLALCQIYTHWPWNNLNFYLFQFLQVKNRKLEQLLQLKDLRIDELMEENQQFKKAVKVKGPKPFRGGRGDAKRK